MSITDIYLMPSTWWRRTLLIRRNSSPGSHLNSVWSVEGREKYGATSTRRRRRRLTSKRDYFLNRFPLEDLIFSAPLERDRSRRAPRSRRAAPRRAGEFVIALNCTGAFSHRDEVVPVMWKISLRQMNIYRSKYFDSFSLFLISIEC